MPCSPQWLPLNAHTLLDVLQEVRGRLCHHVLHSELGLWERERAGFTTSHTHNINISTFRYSVNRFMKPMKCSALRMFPGMASADRDRQHLTRIPAASILLHVPCNTSSGKTGGKEKHSAMRDIHMYRKECVS